MQSHYEVLGVSRSATNDEIHVAYKKLAMKNHPDKNLGNEEEATKKMDAINAAYETLSDSVKKYDYDQTLPAEVKPSSPPKSYSAPEKKSSAYSYVFNSEEAKPQPKPAQSSPAVTKTISKIASGEKLEHKGDLIIEQDIEEGAELKIIDGSLTVKGNIRKGAKITGTSSSGNKGHVSFSGGSIRVTGGGSVSIINGVVYIDGVQVNPNSSNVESKPSNILVHGSVMDDVTIKTENEIEIKKNIGKNCKIKSESGGLTATNIGEGTSVTTYKDITLANAGDDCQFKSSMYGLNGNIIGKSAVIETYKDVKVDQIGGRSRVQSSMYGITINQIVNDNVTLKSYKDIYVHTVGNSCDFTSSMYSVTLKGKAGDDLYVSAYKDVGANSVGAKARITSSMYGVTIQDLGPRAIVRAYKDITIRGNCSPDADCESSMGKVKKYRSVEDRSFFEAKKSSSAQEGIPPHFLCPITKKIMTSPVVFSEDGVTYEESAIKSRLKQAGYSKDQMDDLLTPNRVVTLQIATYLETHPEQMSSFRR